MTIEELKAQLKPLLDAEASAVAAVQAPAKFVAMHHLDNANKAWAKCSEATNPVAQGIALRLAITEWASALLETTFTKESELVSNAFADTLATEAVSAAIAQPKALCLAYVDVFGTERLPLQHTDPMVSVLGKEIAEVCHWRSGALSYMRCKVVEQSKETEKFRQASFTQLIENGIEHFEEMFQVRCNEEWDSVVTNDESTREMMKLGIVSDTNVLALMYACELCYWHVIYCPVEHSARARAHSILNAKMFAGKYKRVVTEFLPNQGWNLETADRILLEIGTIE